MHPAQITHKLDDELDEWDADRDYLGMSAIGQCPRRLYDDFINGRTEPSPQQRRYCHEGYLHQADVVARLNRGGFLVTNEDRELVAPCDPRFKGHIDGEILDGLLEIKSVNPDKFELIRHAPPAEHIAQCQCYMHYGGYIRAMLIYKNRESGELWCHQVNYDRHYATVLERKALDILAAVDAGVPLACECGWCQRHR